MTIHSSLRGGDNLVGRRSVLTRVERIEKLAKDGKFDESSDSVYGLPKVRTAYKVTGGKKAKALEKEREEGLAAKLDGTEEEGEK